MVNIWVVRNIGRRRFRDPLHVVVMVVFMAVAAGHSRGQSGFSDMNVPYPDHSKAAQVEDAKAGAVNGRLRGRGIGRQTVNEKSEPTAYFVGRDGSANWSTGSAQVDDFVRESAVRNRIDPYFIYCVMNQESSFQPRAVSRKGASGLMQLMPGTAARFGVTNIFDAQQNIEGAARYLRFLIDVFGEARLDLVLAGYNAGENAVVKYGWSVPPYQETRDYVRMIAHRYGGVSLRGPRP